MSGHTPGEWVFDQQDHSVRAGALLVGQVSISSGRIKIPEAHANGAMFAAAPELLEALKLCAAVCAGETMSKSGLVGALETARAAIAKATQP